MAQTLKIQNDLSEIDRIREFLRDNLRGHDVSEKAAFSIELSVLEICINIIRYAFPNKKGEIVLKSWIEKDRIYFEVRDRGIPFDPTKLKKPEIQKILDNTRRGGLGIFLTRKLMDGFVYKRVKGQNVLTLYKRIESFSD